MGALWRRALVGPDGVAPIRMVGMSASVNLPLHHKVQKFSSGTGSPRWSRKKGRKMVVCVCVPRLILLRKCKYESKNWSLQQTLVTETTRSFHGPYFKTTGWSSTRFIKKSHNSRSPLPVLNIPATEPQNNRVTHLVPVFHMWYVNEGFKVGRTEFLHRFRNDDEAIDQTNNQSYWQCAVWRLKHSTTSLITSRCYILNLCPWSDIDRLVVWTWHRPQQCSRRSWHTGWPS